MSSSVLDHVRNGVARIRTDDLPNQGTVEGMIEYRRVSGYTHLLTVQAFNGEQIVGQLTWVDDSRTVQGVWVHESYRRQGIATMLLRFAEEIGGYVISHSILRTHEGHAWSASTGNPRPESNSKISNYRPYLRKPFKEFA